MEAWTNPLELWALDPSVAHLNHGSYGAVPRRVSEAQEELRRRMEANPDRFFTRELGPRLSSARERAAGFLRADPGCVGWVENATTGVGAVLGSLDFAAGDEILLTDHAYPAVLLAAQQVCARTGASLRFARVPLDARPADAAGLILAETGTSTKLAILDEISSPTARRFPVADLVPVFRELGVLCLVDAAHAPGMIDVDLATLDPDFWVGNFHKWAFAPRGAGALYVRPALRGSMRPAVVSHFVERGFPGSFDFTGTRDYTPFLCVPEAIAFLEELGPRRLRENNRRLVLEGRDAVAGGLGTTAAYDDELADGVSMCLVPLPEGVAAGEKDAHALMARAANELGAELAFTSWSGRGFLRLSAQAYNRLEEYETLAKLLPDFVADA